MGGSSSSEAPPSSGRSHGDPKSHKERKRREDDKRFEERVAAIFAEASKKKNESLAAEAARDRKTKELIRDVLKEYETNKKSNSPTNELANRNATLMSVLTELMASQGGNPDKTAKMINQLLDMQQQPGGAGIGTDQYLAKFIERQLELLQSSQNVKITVEKNSGGGGGSSRQQNVGATSAGPSRATPSVPTKPSLPAYSQVRQPPPEPAYFPAPPPSYAESVPLHNHPPQTFPYPPPAFEGSPFIDPPHLDKKKGFGEKQSYTKRTGNKSNDNGPFLDKGTKDGGYRVDQDVDGNFYVKVPPSLLDLPLKNGENYRGGRGGQNYGPNERGGQNYGPNYRGGKNFGPNERGGQNFGPNGRGGQNYGPNERGGQNFGPNYRGGKNYGPNDRGGQHFGPNGRGEFPHDPQNQYQNRGGRGGQNYGPNGGSNEPHQQYQEQRGGRGGPRYYGPDERRSDSPNQQYRGGRGGQYYGADTRRSASPHHTQNRYQNREEDPGNDPSQGPNQEGGFQNRGRGYRRPFQGRGTGHPEHFQNPGQGVFEQPHPFGQQPDASYQQNEPGQRGRWNNRNPRSYSQPRTRNAHQSAEGPGDEEQQTDKQGYKGPRGRFRGQGAFPKGKPKQKKQPKSREGVENADPQNDANDSDAESVKSFVSNVSSKNVNAKPKFQLKDGVYVASKEVVVDTSLETDISLYFARSFKAGVYVASEDGTVFTTMEEMRTVKAALLPTPVANIEKKKRNKVKNKVKKASSVTNISVLQDEAAVVGQSDVSKEALAPLKLFRAGLADNLDEDPDKLLEDAVVLIAKVGNAVESCHPTTVGELCDFKKKHPNAEIIVVG